MNELLKNSHEALGLVEAGGTKFNCAVYRDGEIVSEVAIPTTIPEKTLAETLAYFVSVQAQFGKLSSLGLASFGPVDLNLGSPTYGYITSTPKEHWSNTDMVGFYKKSLDLPVGFNTDVNGAALGEANFGAAQQINNFVYVTVGTGVGAGIVINGNLLHGATHPEIGHLLVPSFSGALNTSGGCSFHGGMCLEGVAAGPSLLKRWGQAGHELNEDHEAWREQAHYLAVMCMNLCAIVAPEKIIIGGGVMNQSHLFPMIRNKFAELSNGYFDNLFKTLDEFIVPTPLKGKAGLLGAAILAKNILK